MQHTYVRAKHGERGSRFNLHPQSNGHGCVRVCEHAAEREDGVGDCTSSRARVHCCVRACTHEAQRGPLIQSSIRTRKTYVSVSGQEARELLLCVRAFDVRGCAAVRFCVPRVLLSERALGARDGAWLCTSSDVRGCAFLRAKSASVRAYAWRA